MSYSFNSARVAMSSARTHAGLSRRKIAVQADAIGPTCRPPETAGSSIRQPRHEPAGWGGLVRPQPGGVPAPRCACGVRPDRVEQLLLGQTAAALAHQKGQHFERLGSEIPPSSRRRLNASGSRDADLCTLWRIADADEAAAGLHKFQCCIHPWMRGAVRVN